MKVRICWGKIGNFFSKSAIYYPKVVTTSTQYSILQISREKNAIIRAVFGKIE
jgi:hypothetical protein